MIKGYEKLTLVLLVVDLTYVIAGIVMLLIGVAALWGYNTMIVNLCRVS